jgi:flagellar protein FlbD
LGECDFMIELTQLNGTIVTINCDLIETVENIPETKVTLTTDKYLLVAETREEITEKVITYRRKVFQGLFDGSLQK